MRTVLRGLLAVALVAVLGFPLFGYWTGSLRFNPTASGSHGIDAPRPVDVQKARERGAALGEKVGAATAKVQETLAETGITAKIKAKMALDDAVNAHAIDVSTDGSTVMLTGTVGSRAEHDRALSLARETAGVARVVDHLVLQSR
jgi:hyperosmotically inducible periplasmic protein